MLSISLAYNVISCKKIERNTQKCKFGSRAQKWPKIAKKKRITQSRFTQFFYGYGIFWIPLGKSSHPGSSEYVWQREVEGILGWVTGGRCLPYFQKKKKLKCGVKKNRYGHNFQNIASKMNQRVVIGYDPTLIRFGSDILKFVAVSVFFNTAF